MPRKNPDRDDLQTYKVHFINKDVITVHTPEELIKTAGKPDKGGYHPIFIIDDEILLNMNNVNYIDNVTPPPVAKGDDNHGN